MLFNAAPKKDFCCLNPHYMDVFIAALATVSYNDSSEPFWNSEQHIPLIFSLK